MVFTRLNTWATFAVLLLSMLASTGFASDPGALKSGVEMGLFTAGDVTDYMRYVDLCKVVLCCVPLFLAVIGFSMKPTKESVGLALVSWTLVLVITPAVLWLLHFLMVGDAFAAVHSSYMTDQIRRLSSGYPEIAQALGNGIFSGTNLVRFEFFLEVKAAMLKANLLGMIVWFALVLFGHFQMKTDWIRALGIVAAAGLLVVVVRIFVIDDYAAIESVFKVIEAKQYLQ